MAGSMKEQKEMTVGKLSCYNGDCPEKFNLNDTCTKDGVCEAKYCPNFADSPVNQEWATMNFPKDPTRDYSISNAEIDIQIALNTKGYGPYTQFPFTKTVTVADFFFPNEKLAVFIDGEHVHRNKELEDEDKRDFVRRQGCTVRSYSYKSPITKKRLKEIVDAIIDDVTGLRRMNK